MDWALRPATLADDAFFQRVYAGTRADEMALTPWDAAQRQAFVAMQYRAQAAHYLAHWPDAQHSVVVALHGGEWHDVGRLWLHQRPAAIHVLDIALLAEHRGLGIGAACLQQLMRQAQTSARAVTIHVEAGNPARRLYERLGFLPVGAPQGVHQRMAWQAVAADLACRSTTEAMEIGNEQA